MAFTDDPLQAGQYRGLMDTLASIMGHESAERLCEFSTARFSAGGHGDWPRWWKTLKALPDVAAEQVDLNSDSIRVSGRGGALGCADIDCLLRELHPWRKGPYAIHGVAIDSEWRSDLKWQRLEAQIASLAGRSILDVGCGNGYHVWRMLGAGARAVIGIDPTLLSVAQFLAIKHFAGEFPAFVLPLGIEAMPPDLRCFDTVFSMGVFYHRRSPLDHLLELRGCLRSGGELVLETLVIDGPDGQVLVPEGRYAQMRNVWFLPACGTLIGWLKRCGFQRPRLIDVSVTGIEEQRRTEWMQFQSLPDFLDPADPTLTIEGLPAPRRGIFIAEAP